MKTRQAAQMEMSQDQPRPDSALFIAGTALLGFSLSAGAVGLYLVLTGSPFEIQDASARPSKVATEYDLEQRVADPDAEALVTVVSPASPLASSVFPPSRRETPTPLAGGDQPATEPLRLFLPAEPHASLSTRSDSQDVRRPLAVRVGGNVRMPIKIRNVDPKYPSIARATRMEGNVVLKAVISVEGRVTDVRVTNSAPLFDEAAVSAVWQWRYEPALLNGMAVPVSATINVSFVL